VDILFYTFFALMNKMLTNTIKKVLREERKYQVKPLLIAILKLQIRQKIKLFFLKKKIKEKLLKSNTINT
jgi:hypothetical protein